MAATTVGKVLLKHFLPISFHNFIENNILDKKGLGKLFADLAEKHPDEYGHIVSDMTRLGFEISTRQGTSIMLDDLVSPIDRDKEYDKFDKFVDETNSSSHPENVKKDKIFKKYNEIMAGIDKDILEKGLADNKSLAKIIAAGSRGTPAQYRSTITTQGIVVDAEGKPHFDIPIKSSFAEGLSLPEYLTTSYGVRAGEVSKKLGVADGGYSSKQFARASLPLKIEEYDCGTENGYLVPTTDKESVGAFLARGVKSYNRNNEVTLNMLNDLKEKGVKDILVRSPITCQASKKYHFGAVCQLCIGKREKGLPQINSHVGLVASTALAEPLTELPMKARHGGGAATSINMQSGFKLIDQLANIPKTFVNKAPLAEEDGIITSVEKAAAGGYFIRVNNKEHYIGVGLEPTVKEGQEVEQGDVLSTGIVDPREVVRYKGVGEGRRYYAQSMKNAFDTSGIPINRRNFEIIARSAIDHVKITDPEGLGNYLPEQIVSYSAIEKDYAPRKNAKQLRTDLAYGKFLEKPELHYTIGTRLTTSTIDELKRHDIESVLVNDEPPHFEPIMVRLVDIPETVDDWAHQIYSTNIEKRFLNLLTRGADSSVKGPSPVMGLAYGIGFGDVP